MMYYEVLRDLSSSLRSLLILLGLYVIHFDSGFVADFVEVAVDFCLGYGTATLPPYASLTLHRQMSASKVDCIYSTVDRSLRLPVGRLQEYRLVTCPSRIWVGSLSR